MRFVKIGDAEIDPEQVAGFSQRREPYQGSVKAVIFLKSGQTVTTTLPANSADLKTLLTRE